jgi:hypothetical protein
MLRFRSKKKPHKSHVGQGGINCLLLHGGRKPRVSEDAMCGLLLRLCHRQNNWRHMSALCSMGQAAHWLRQPSSASNVWIGDTGKQDL